MRKIELLAPARDPASGIAAVDHGADAVYIGGRRFGARYAAGNTAAEVARLCEYARPFGVRVYAALNTLIYPDELEEAELAARELISAGVDALIVQDMAFMRMGLEGVEMHASTQVCNMTPGEVAFLGHAGFSRVILERNLTLDEIKGIRAATGVELECFVHGAICVGYSGRCYLSRSAGARSGNRGECTQPCRLPYDLELDGKTVVRGKHLLSIRDMNLSARLGDLLDAGVTSFKIEGRLKDSGYIRNVVSWYRDALDREMERREGFVRSSAGSVRRDFAPDPAKSFTRGSTTYFLDGRVAGVASFDTPKAFGEHVGRVADVARDRFRLDGGEALSPGDGICFLADGELVGTNVNRVDGDAVWPNRMDGIGKGTEVYRNHDHRFSTMLARSRTRRSIGVDAVVRASTDGVTLRLTNRYGIGAEAACGGPFEEARDRVGMEESIRSRVSRSGDTIFDMETVAIEGDALPFMSCSALNALRREALDRLLKRRMEVAPERAPAAPESECPFPQKVLDGRYNVTNPLAREFYMDHGVESTAPGLDLSGDMAGETVMETSYCIRREMGQCLLDDPLMKGDMSLRHGESRYRLVFDCRQCRMKLICNRDILK